MASIPLPALQAGREQGPSPLELMGQMIQMRNAKQQGQLLDQQTVAAQQGNAMQAQQMKDQQTVMSVLGETGGDVDKALPLLAGKVAPQTLMGLQKSHLETRKTLAEINDKELASNKYKNSQFLQLVAQAKQLPPEQYAQQFPQIAAAANQIHPEHQIDPNQPIPQNQLDSIGIGLMTQEQYFSQEETRRAAEKAQREQTTFQTELPGKIADSKMKTDEAALPPVERALKGQNALEYFAAKGDPLAQKALEKHIEVAKASRPVNNNGIGEISPAMVPLVDEVGMGKMAIGKMEYILARNPNLMAAVAQKYPDFDSSKIKSYSQAYRDYTGAGKIGTQLNAGSTAMRHFARLKEINDQNTTSVRIPGTEANKAYNNLLDTVAGEVLTFYGTPKTNETLANVKATLGGLTNRDSAITEQALAMGAKFDELENTWKNAAPSAAYQKPMPGYSAETKAARAKLDPEYAQRQQQAAPQGGGGQEGVQVSDPRGVVHTFPNQQAADNFKRAAGIR